MFRCVRQAVGERGPLADVPNGVGSCRSSPTGGGGPCEAWWRGTRGVSCPLYVTRPRPYPPTTLCGPPSLSGGERPLPVDTDHSLIRKAVATGKVCAYQ